MSNKTQDNCLQGWAFYWGTSEWDAQQITHAWAVCGLPISC